MQLKVVTTLSTAVQIFFYKKNCHILDDFTFFFVYKEVHMTLFLKSLGLMMIYLMSPNFFFTCPFR